MEARESNEYRVSTGWRWAVVALSPPLIALMLWAAWEGVRNYLSPEGESNIWLMILALLIFGSLILVFLGAIVWAFRARVVIEGERMTVRGALLSRIIDAERIEGYRYFNGQLHVYLKDRQWPVQLAYFEELQTIDRWVRGRSENLDLKDLEKEDEEISRDMTLGLSETEKKERLSRLRRLIRPVNFLAYIGAVAGFFSFLFIEQHVVTALIIGTLVVIPILLDVIALANRGHVRIDYREGTRYPEIFSGTMACGIALALTAMLDKGALIGNAFYQWLVPAAAAKGLLWCFIDLQRLRETREQGILISAITLTSFFLIPAFWVGGSVYQINKYLDDSPVAWHATEILDKEISRGKGISYHIDVASWDQTVEGPVEIALRRAQFEQFEVGMAVEVGVRRGALEIPRVAEIRKL